MNRNRKLNGKLLLCLSVATALLGAGVHLLHEFQVRRGAGALLGQVDQAEKRGDLDKAKEYLGRYLAYEPTDAAGLARYGRLLEGRARTDAARREAIRAYEKALRSDPGLRDVRRRLVDLAMAMREPPLSEAKAHLVLLQRDAGDGERGELECLLGRCEEGLGNFEAAAKLYEAARTHEPGRVEGYERLANLLRQRLNDAARADRLMDAERVEDGLIAHNDRSAQAFLARARYRAKFGVNPAGADADVARALELAQDDPDVLLIAAEAARARDDLEQARGLLRRGLGRRPDSVPLARALASVEAQAGRVDEAVASLNQAVETNPDDVEPKWSLAEVLIQSGQLDKADEAIGKLKEAGVRAELLGYLEAFINVQRGREAEAAKVLREVCPALAVQPEWRGPAKRGFILLGQCYEASGNADACLTAYGQAVAIGLDPDPMWGAAHLGLARALERLNKVDEALAEYRLVLRRDPAPAVGGPMVRLLISRNLRLPAAERGWDEVDRVLGGLERTAPDSFDVAMLRAEALAARDQLGPAREALEKARDEHPDRVEPWVALAGLAGLAPDAKPEAGLAVLDDAQRRLGDRLELRLARAALWARRGGEPARAALEALERDAEKFAAGDRARLWRVLAAADLRVGATEQADRLWARLAEEVPNDLNVRYTLFERALATGDEVAAKKALGQIRAIEGDDGLLWRFGEAALLVQRARKAPGDRTPLAEARGLLTHIAELRPSWSRIPLALAEVDDLAGDPEGAIKNYQRAILEFGERSPQVIRRAAQLLYQRQQYAQASQLIRKLEQDKAPLSDELNRLAAAVSLRTQDYGRALELAEKSASERSDDYRELIWLGQVRSAAGQPAEPVFRRAVALAGDVPDTWVALVLDLAGTNQKDKAEAATREAEARLSDKQADLALALCNEVIGRVDRAGELYRAALAARPDDIPTLRNVASFHLRVGRPEEAKTLLRRIVALKGGSPEADWATQTLAIVTALGGGHTESVEAMEILGVSGKAPSGKAPSPATLRVQARLLAVRPNRAQRREAIAILEGLAGRETPTEDDLFLLAQLHEANGDWQEARRVMLQLLDQQGKKPPYLAHYTLSLLRQGQADEAQLWLGKLEQADPKSFRTLVVKARVLAARGRTDEAVALLKKDVQDDPSHVGPVGALLEQLGRDDAAEQAYRQFVDATRSRRPEAVLVLASYLGRRGRTAQALDLLGDDAWRTIPVEKVSNTSVTVLYGARRADEFAGRVASRLEEAIRAHPDKIALQFDLANLRILQERYADAESIFRKVYERDKTRGGALNNLAWMLALRGGKAAEALPLIQRAIELEGETPDLLDTRALAYLALGQADPAIRDLQEAIAVRPAGDKYFHLAQALRKAGRPQEAGEAFRKAKELGLTVESLHPLERQAFDSLLDNLAQK